MTTKKFHFNEIRAVARDTKKENNMPSITQTIAEKIENINLIQAAMAKPSFLPIKRLCASADINLDGRISVAELDRKLDSSRLTTRERLEVKAGLAKAGLLG